MTRTPSLAMALGTIVFVTACSAEGDGVAETSVPEAPETTTTEALESTTTTTAVTTTTTSAPTATVFEADWDPEFTLMTPPSWREESTIPSTLVMRAGSSYVVFSTGGPDSVDGWLELLASNTDIVITQPTAIELGSAAGYVVDVRLSDDPEEVCGFGIGPCSTLLTDGNGWVVVEGTPNRLWVVDVNGETVVVVTEASEGVFETWAAEVDEVLSTITWD